jgi:acetyl-CoA C-acetyltransferase
MNLHMLQETWLMKNKPEVYWSMLQTAEQVAKRYNISREAMDEYGAASQQKASAALEAGLFKDEIAPITVTMGVADKVMGLTTKQVTVSDDEGIRAGTTYDGIKGLRSALPGGLISAGNASQLSDGAGAVRGHARRPGRARRASSPWAASWALPWPVASPTKWASAPCSPSPRCSSAWASR